jgi:hypothetical protein
MEPSAFWRGPSTGPRQPGAATTPGRNEPTAVVAGRSHTHWSPAGRLESAGERRPGGAGGGVVATHPIDVAGLVLHHSDTFPVLPGVGQAFGE